jgi:hypothetical protein
MDTLQYYELKQKYQETMDRRKKVIKKKDISTKEKRTEIKKLIMNCVNCGKPGGTIFEEKNGILKAVCLAKPPCNLNINIKRKFYDNVRELEQKNNKTSENLKMRIIMTKLDYLFGLISSKDEVVDKFNTLKSELAQVSEEQLIIQKKYGDILSGVHREPLLNDAAINLVEEISELKKIYAEYLLEPLPAYLTNMVEKYITTIKPLTEKIRNMNYGYYAIETNKPEEVKTTAEGVNAGEGEGDGEGEGEKKTKKSRKDNLIYTLVARPYSFEQFEQERK